MLAVIASVALSLFLCLCRAQLVFEVPEEQPAPVLLGNIATSAKITSIPHLEFSLLNRKDLFHLNESSGDFSTRTSLDREALCGSVPSCVLSCSVAVSSAPDFFQRYPISVVIQDVNDQKPRFSIPSFVKSLSERTEVNTSMKLPLAYDNDYEPRFKVQSYRLEPENGHFQLSELRSNRSDGSVDFDLHLVLVKTLDREIIGSYTLTLVAVDGGEPKNEGKLQVIINVIDENDNEPKFEKTQYDVFVKETVEPGTLILNVSAMDADDAENGRVGYEFSNDVDRKVLEYFLIERTSGAVSLLKSLEEAAVPTFAFKITAFDHGTPMMSSETSVRITVEDTVNNPPSININRFRSRDQMAVVPEDVLVGTKLALVDVLDTDTGQNGLTNCTATNDRFHLEEYNSLGEYTVSVAKDLDRETAATHTILIICHDSGSPPLSSTASLSVLVEDVNDNRPVFTRKTYQMTVQEGKVARSQLGVVSAVDADEGINAQIRYSLELSVSEFVINESTGVLSSSLLELDRESKDVYVFHVYASDNGSHPLTGTATVSITVQDINDESPRFDNATYIFLVSESATKNSLIGQLRAVDLDLGLGGLVEYYLANSVEHPNLPFSLSQEKGTLTLTQPLDFETVQSYRLTVIASDLGQPPRNSSVEVQIHVLDENDNTPVIVFPSKDNLTVTLNLQAFPGYEIVKVIAHDSDKGENGRLSYTLDFSNIPNRRLFGVNEVTGVVTLLSRLGEADLRSYNVSVQVRDNGKPVRLSQAVLQVDVVLGDTTGRVKVSYTLVVIIMVCVTFFVAVIVLVTFCLLRYLDSRKFFEHRQVHRSTFEPTKNLPKPTFDTFHHVPDDQTRREKAENELYTQKGISIEAEQFSPQPVSKTRRGAKCVTFGEAVGTSLTSHRHGSFNLLTNSDSPAPPRASSPSMGHGSYLPSTFYSVHPPNTLDPYPSTSSPMASFRHGVTGSEVSMSDPRSGAGRQSEKGQVLDEMVSAALENHIALVRSMKGKILTDGQDFRQVCTPPRGRDLDICSSSSAETSDSGHGGSEPDVLVSKAGV